VFHATKVAEVALERLHPLERERVERRVGRVRLRERDDVGGIGGLAQPLDQPRPDGHRGRDPLRVAAANLHPVEPGVDLVRRQLPGERREPEPPRRHLHPDLMTESQEAGEELRGLEPALEVRVNRLVGAELGQAQDRMRHVALRQEGLQLVAQA
jgi:hypothetical protein